MDTPNMRYPNGRPYRSQSWKPLAAIAGVVVLAGLVLDTPSRVLEAREESVSRDLNFDDVAIMSAVKRGSESGTFRGGEATAVMGGIDIDLRQATMEGSEAVLDVSSVMGGVKVRVPASWTVVSKVNTIMGGFANNSRRPPQADRRLILKGSVVMGGLNVTN